jgi:hypothetical protein
MSVPVSVRAVDVGSGVDQVTVSLFPPYSRAEETQAVVHDPPTLATDLKLTSGTVHDGIWTGTLRVPRCSRTGQHQLIIDVTDRTGRGPYYGYHGKKLLALGVPARVDIVAAKDTYLPTATRQRVGPRRVLVRFDEGVINVTAKNLPLVDYRPIRHTVATHVSCRDTDRKLVPCTGRAGLIRSAILIVGKHDVLSHSWRIFPNGLGVQPQVTDRYGNPVYSETSTGG